MVIVNCPTRGTRPTRRLRRSRRLAVSIPIALLAVTACITTEPTADTEPGATTASASPTARPSSIRSSASQPTPEESNVSTVRITVADQTITAQLADIPTAQALIDQLP